MCSFKCKVCSLQCQVRIIRCAVCSVDLGGPGIISAGREGGGDGGGVRSTLKADMSKVFSFLLGGGLGLGLEQGAKELEGLEELGIKEEDMRDYLYLGTPIALVGAVEIVQCVVCNV